MIAQDITRDPFTVICAFVVGVLGVTRIVHLIVDDDYPPVEWAKNWYCRHVPPRWQVLVECPWCVAPYITFVSLMWAWASDLHWSWWVAHLWAGVSWLASYAVMRDVPEDQR